MDPQRPPTRTNVQLLVKWQTLACGVDLSSSTAFNRYLQTPSVLIRKRLDGWMFSSDEFITIKVDPFSASRLSCSHLPMQSLPWRCNPTVILTSFDQPTTPEVLLKWRALRYLLSAWVIGFPLWEEYCRTAVFGIFQIYPYCFVEDPNPIISGLRLNYSQLSSNQFIDISFP